MGINNGRDVLYSITGLSMSDIGDICKGLAAEASMETPTVDVDCSNVCFKVGKDASSVSNFLMKYAKTGVCFVPVCDGTRPISKQATNEREAKREKSRIKAFHLRRDILALQRQLKHDSLTDSEKNDIRDEVATKQRSMKSKETQSRNVIQQNFEDKLVEELEQTGAHSRNLHGGSVGHVIMAEYQADAVMMGRAVSRETLMVMTSDADIPIIAGDCCIAIKEFTKDGSIEIVCTSNQTLINALNHLRHETKPNIIPAKHPIFEGVPDRKLRALMALFLGCDVLTKGIPGVGPSTLSDIITVKFPEFKQRCPNATLFGYLKKYLYHHIDGYDNDVVHTYIRALVYEPTNAAPAVDDCNDDGDDPAIAARTYLDGVPPSKLPKYLEEFATDGVTEIVDGPAMEVCKGVGARTHKFLCADGYSKCKMCDDVVCKLCHETIDDVAHCLPCYAAESLVPESNLEEATSISTMREELAKKYDVEKANELTVEEVEDLYALKEIATARIKKLFDNVPFPKHASSEIDAEVTEEWSNIMDINFGEGGAFLSDPDLDAQYLPGILELFASLVSFESEVRTDWVKDPMIYDAMPSMFIDFAQKSRVDNGYRLLMRCVRHAFDSRCKSIDKGTGSLIIDMDGDIGIQLGTSIPASMKKSVYETEIVATAKNLLCCKCTCQCGSQNDQRIVCVHTLVVLYLLTMLMIEDLAEHMLIALASRINGAFESTANEIQAEDDQWMWNMSNWSDDDVKSMKKNVVTLMEAAGESTSKLEKTLPELLQSFVVGTERRKEWKERSKLPPKPSELGPISEMKFMSTSRRAKLTMHRQETSNHDIQPGCQSSNLPSANSRSLPSSAPNNHCVCSYPNCNVDGGQLQSLIKCKVGSCQRVGHRLCQDDMESFSNWIHHENEVYCFECHPKECDDKEETLFTPNYVKILSLMKASGCNVDDSPCTGHRLLLLRGYAQTDGGFSKQSALDKEASCSWIELKKSAAKRSLNQTDSQRKNLKIPHQCSTPTTRNVPSPTSVADTLTTAPHVNRCHLRRTGQTLPLRQEPMPEPPLTPAKKRGKFVKCHKCGATNKGADGKYKGMKYFRRVPAYPANLKAEKPRKGALINYHGRLLLRKEIMRRMNLSENDKRKDLFICTNNHRFEAVHKSISIKFKPNDPEDKGVSHTFKLIVPEDYGAKSSRKQSTSSLGVGADREVIRRVAKINQVINEGSLPPDFSFEEMKEDLNSTKPASPKEEIEHAEHKAMIAEAECEFLRAELFREKLARAQDWEQNSNDGPMNPSLKRAAGLDVHADVPTTPNKRFFTKSPLPRKKKKDDDSRKERHEHVKDPPKVTLDLPDHEVHRRTGFPSMQHMLSYIFIICNGNVDCITSKKTVLTWFEAWFMHFEFKWGRTLTRVTDVSGTYGPIPKYVRREVSLKYNIERRARDSWPRYASYTEDKRLRDSDKWDRKYAGIRPVMWDMTNIPAYGFSDADSNRLTYSKYYAQNCFKGGIGTQLCGWILTANLWTGAVSDTDYNKRAGYLQEQEHFQKNDLVRFETIDSSHDELIPFTNIYDKGYRAKLVAWRTGKQRVLQPVWAESDRRFDRDGTLLTASVATDRGANERAVNVCKRALYVSRGFHPGSCPKQLNDAWMTWSFQANFMYSPVL